MSMMTGGTVGARRNDVMKMRWRACWGLEKRASRLCPGQAGIMCDKSTVRKMGGNCKAADGGDTCGKQEQYLGENDCLGLSRLRRA